MKLRVRVPGSSETHRVATPEVCTVGTLRALVTRLLPAGTSPTAVRLSLNNRDEVAPGADGLTLQSAGICNGDLVHVLGCATASVAVAVAAAPAREVLHSDVDARRARCLQAAQARAGGQSGVLSEPGPAVVPSPSARHGDAAPSGGDGDGDVHMAEDATPEAAAAVSALPPPGPPAVPAVLRQVVSQVQQATPHAALAPAAAVALALHAAMLDTGFVDVTAAPVPSETTAPHTTRFWYALPHDPATHAAWLRVSAVGGDVIAYGGLVASPDDVLRVAVPSQRFVAALPPGAPAGSLPLAQLPALWTAAKDGIAAPLLRWAYLHAGLEPPIPSLLSLPQQVKHLVLGALPSQALATVACVCRDLRFAASDDTLWRALYDAEFGNGGGGAADGAAGEGQEAIVRARGWRVAFGAAWRARAQAQRRAAMAADMRRRRPRPHIFPVPGMPQPPVPGIPGGFPGIIGGDYDLYPGGRGAGGGAGGGGFGFGFGGGRGMYNLDPTGGRGRLGAPPHGPGRLFRDDAAPY